VAKVLETTVPLDERYSPDQVKQALDRMLPSLTFQRVPLRVEWYSPTHGRIYLAPFAYRQMVIKLYIEQEGGQRQLHAISDKVNLYRVPLLYRRELRELWASILDRLHNLERL
jgi:hypothetical protein